jgi:hypothetical protein
MRPSLQYAPERIDDDLGLVVRVVRFSLVQGIAALDHARRLLHELVVGVYKWLPLFQTRIRAARTIPVTLNRIL